MICALSYTMDFPTIKRNEVLTRVATRMSLEIIVLSGKANEKRRYDI